MKQYENFLEKEKSGNFSLDDFTCLWKKFKNDLNNGQVRAANKDEFENWKVNKTVKQFILMGFKYGNIIYFRDGYFDKNTMGEKIIKPVDGIRTVSPTTSIRDGVYIGKNATFMPPCYANIGAYIDENSLIDSSSLVGSCAQIGKKVHIGAGTVIGGVLEPVEASPVIVEDNVFVGANSSITEGTIIKKNAIIGAGVTITGSTPIYDLVKGNIIKPNEAGQIIVPEGAVVVQGSRKIETVFDVEISINTPIIIKYGKSIEFEDLLRTSYMNDKNC